MSLNKYVKLYAPPCYINSQGELAMGTDMQIVNWHKQEIEKSKNFLRSQRGWKSADNCMSILNGDENPKPCGRLSVLTIKKLRRQAREAIANSSNIRPRWQTKAKEQYAETAEIYNKRREAWFYCEFVDRYIKETLQWGGGAGTGYLMLWPEYDHRKCKTEIKPKVLSHKNVFPFHASADSRIESVNGISCWFEMALPEAHRKWPEFMDIINADRDVPSTFAGRFEKVRRKWKGVVDWVTNAKSQDAEFSPYPVADIFYTWIWDETINESGHEIMLGEPNTDWAYTVPSLFAVDGKQNKLLNGKVVNTDSAEYNDSKARFITRHECKLFPMMRFMITTNYGVIYDGPPYWVCNRPPLEWFKFEELAGEWLGISLIRDGRNPERASNNLLRAIEDSIVGKLEPPVAINDKLPKDVISRLKRSVRQMIGMVFKYNTMIMEKALIPLLPHEYFNIDTNAVELVKFLHEMSDYLMGTSDFSAWQRLKQLPAADTQEAMIQNLGILATDHERMVERSLLAIGDIWQQFAPQVYKTDELITTLGVDGMSEETWDFKADSLFPSPTQGDTRSVNQRLLDHMKIFSIYAAPHSMQERLSVTNKLTLMQLKKVGVPISDEKLYEAFLDDGDYKESLKQFNAEQEAKILLSARLEMELRKAAEAANPQNQLANKMLEAVRGQNNNEGRPPSNTTPPRLEQKTDQDGIPRGTVATS